jgi:hypothetical protein
MTTRLAVFGGLGLLLALVLALGPGMALLSFFSQRQRFDRTQATTIAIGLALAAWPIALAWLQALHLALSAWSVLGIAIGSWSIGLWKLRPWKHVTALRFDPSRVMLWSVVLIVAVVGLTALRNVVVGPGSDAYHHTLITQLIVERGRLPDNYEPYAPLVSFTYHFGFHTFAAVLSLLSGLSPVIVAPIAAQVLVAFAALSVAFLAEQMTSQKWLAAVSALIAGLVSIFPAYYINWGRYTQLTGLVLLPIFLGIVWHWAMTDRGWRDVPLIGLLAAGITLAHYRVTLMTASAVIFVIGLNGVFARWRLAEWRQVIGRLIAAAVIAGLLIAPWVWHVFISLRQGYPIVLGSMAPLFFQLDRLGPYVLNYPTNRVFLGLLAMALIAGWLRRQRVVISLSIWSAGMWVLSGPRLAGAFMDTISVLISLYIPAAIISAWFVVTIGAWLRQRWPSARWVMSMGLVGLAAWGAVSISNIVETNAPYVGPADLPAIDWIRNNTPVSARFMVNTFHFEYSDNYVLGSDAGYWLPLLAGRATITMPMIYPAERAASPDLLERLVALDRLNGKLTTPEALALMQKEGITHVYVGQRGGPISAEELEESPHFKLAYHTGPVYVFEVDTALLKQ